MTPDHERRLLQAALALAGCVPVLAGGAGTVAGPAMLAGLEAGPTLDSHYRYLSGLLLGIGLIFWAMIPTIERRGAVVRALGLIVVIGGLARLAGLVVEHSAPVVSMRLALVMELLVTPALVIWQARVARRTGL
jgi:hypothetical protein